MNLATLYATRYLPHIRRVLKPRTVAEYERLAARLVMPEFGTIMLPELTLDAVESWHVRISAAGKVQANRALAVLSALTTYAVGRRLLTAHPFRGVERNKERGCEFFYSPGQTKAILNATSASDDIRAKYIALELLTGCRPGELLESCPGWRHGSVLHTPDGKTGGRNIYLPPAACAILDSLPGGRYFPEGMSLRRTWERLCRAAGVPIARRYDLRHTFASQTLAAGTPMAVVSLLLGHTSERTTRRYAHLAPDVGLQAVAAAAARMGAT